MSENYKRATVVVKPKGGIDLLVEGQGPIIMNRREFRTLSIVASEMLNGHATTCWQDKSEHGSYIRAIKEQKLCKVQCTKKMGAVKETRRIPTSALPLRKKVSHVLQRQLGAIKLFKSRG